MMPYNNIVLIRDRNSAAIIPLRFTTRNKDPGRAKILAWDNSRNPDLRDIFCQVSEPWALKL